MVVGISATVVGGVVPNSEGSIRTTGDPLSISIPKAPELSSIAFIDALTKIRLLAMSAVDGLPRVPIVEISESGVPPEPLLPQDTVAVATSPQTSTASFMGRRDLRSQPDGTQSRESELSVTTRAAVTWAADIPENGGS